MQLTQNKESVSKIMKAKNTEIILNDYQKLLLEIQNHVKQTQGKIVKIVTREKVVMAWQIGKIINEHLAKNNVILF